MVPEILGSKIRGEVVVYKKKESSIFDNFPPTMVTMYYLYPQVLFYAENQN